MHEATESAAGSATSTDTAIGGRIDALKAAPNLRGVLDGINIAVPGAMNRAAFTRIFESMADEQSLPAAVAAIRVNSYASAVHRHGQEAGALLLAHVAAILREHLRQDDVVAHFSRDEFMILLPGESEHGLHSALARIEMAVLGRPFRPPGGRSETVRISTGGCQFTTNSMTNRSARDASSRPRIGLALCNPGLAQRLQRQLGASGCEPVNAGASATARYAPFAHHGAAAVVLECEASDLPVELAHLRATLMRDHTPILVLAPNAAAARWALEHGACDALIKPAEPEEIIRTACLLASRGLMAPPPACIEAPPASVLVASDDLVHLIAFGSALERHGGYDICLGRGATDAAGQAGRHPLSCALLNLRLDREDTMWLLQDLAGRQPDRPVVLVTDKGERLAVPDTATLPRIAAVIEKPVPLLTLAGEFRRATGIDPAPGHPARTNFHAELLRVIRDCAPCRSA